MTHTYSDIMRLDGDANYAKYLRPREAMINAQYIAAMPDAVGLLKEFKADNTKLKQLLDRAMQGLENCCGRSIWVDIEVKQTLADIRKQLDGD